MVKFRKILVTGGAGYCGSILVPQLLDRGHDVTVYDIMYYGDSHLPKDNPHLKLVRGDIRDAAHLAGCHIITATNDILRKLAHVGKDLETFSRETVRMFHDDARAAGYTIPTGELDAAE